MPPNQHIFTYAGAAEEDEQTAEGPQGGVRHRTGTGIFFWFDRISKQLAMGITEYIRLICKTFAERIIEGHI